MKLNELSSGYYFIDPNGGGREDAIFAHCNFDKVNKDHIETCVYPQQSTYEVKDWVRSGSDRVTWFMEDIQTTFNDKVCKFFHNFHFLIKKTNIFLPENNIFLTILRTRM